MVKWETFCPYQYNLSFIKISVMSYSKPLSLLLALFLFGNAMPAAAQQEATATDSTFRYYINNAWKKIEASGFDDSLQARYADEFYNYYLQHPDEELGSNALASAFTLWGNTGAAKKFDEAVSRLPYDSEMWQQVIVSGSNAYARSEDHTSESYYKWVQEIKDELTHPGSKSEVLLWLARKHNSEGNMEKVLELSRELININAGEFYVNQALGFQQEVENLGIGVPAPDFKAETLEGKEFSLSKMQGKVVLLEFWATWCGPCLPEIPYLKSIDSTYTAEEFQIVGISLDTDTTELKEFISKEQISWLQIQQAAQWEDKITKRYNVYGIPRSFIIGRDGTIVAKNLRKEALEAKISELMEQQTAE